jgi:DNA-directed RNA polymerase subunit RPC12/RpoP
MAKKIYTCEDCGKTFPAQFQLMLHADFHKGEPVVREKGCFCANYWDIRRGSCHHCGYIHTNGWRVIDGVAVIA